MNKQIAINLKDTAEGVAKIFSNPERSFNNNNELFEVNEIIPLSEDTAIVNFKKSSGKEVLFFFYWVRANGGKWWYFIPSDSHILGMEQFGKYKMKLEKDNFKFNFYIEGGQQ